MTEPARYSTWAALAALAAADPAAAAIVTPDLVLSRADVAARVACIADHLLLAGLVPGRMTAVTLPDEVDHLLVTLALMSLATTSINLPSHDSPASHARVASHLGITQIVLARGTDGPARCRPLHLPPLPTAAPRPETLARLTQAGVALDTQLLYRSTSGTTGTPKTFGVTMTLLAGAILRIAAEPAEACVLRCSSIEYDSTRIYRVMSLLAGRRAAFLPIVSMATLGAFCARVGVTEIHIGTYRLASLLSSPATETDGLPPATRLLTGASRVPGSLRRAVQARLTPNLWISYATSETGVISVAGPDDHPDWPEGVGNVVPGVAVSLRDDAGGCVPRGMIGRAFVCKAGVGPPGHWHDTGDLLSWPPDGPLVFHGRADDMMILNGINVFPGVIEDLLETHPSVAEAVAYPVASAVHGQIPVAAVVLRAPCSAADLLAFARDRLGLLAPRRILIVTEIPRTATGKPKRALMAQMPAT